MARKVQHDATNSPATTVSEHFRQASTVLVAGMSGSARENPALGHPMLANHGDGAWMITSDGQHYLDFFNAFGACILGHNHPAIREAIEVALDLGIIHGPETIYNRQLAERLVELIPSAELVRFANSGSEATMSAIRVARAHTNRNKILKFEGHFHGLQEHVLFSTHPEPRQTTPGELLEPTIDSAGIPAPFAELVLVAPWNDLAAVELAFDEHGNDLAAVIMEPVNYNSGCLVADQNYMQAVRELVTDRGAVLIFDEVLSGFRMGIDCAQGYYGVTPDVTLLGKAVANSIPLSAIVGRRDVMENFSPLGQTAHSGTYSAHLFGVLASLSTLDQLTLPGFYDGPNGILTMADRLYGGLRDIFARHGIRCRVQGLGARFGLYFGIDPDQESKVYQDVARHDHTMHLRFIQACLERNVYFHAYRVALGHHGFGSSHGPNEIDEALDRIDGACAQLT